MSLANPPLLNKPGSAEDLRTWLIANGYLSANALAGAHWNQSGGDALLAHVLIDQGLVNRATMREALARYHATTGVKLAVSPPDLAVLGNLDPRFWVKNNAIPHHRSDGQLWIAVAQPEDFADLLRQLPDNMKPARPLIASRADIQQTLAEIFRDPLTAAASSRVELSESCRSWGTWSQRRIALTVLLPLNILTCAYLFPREAFAVFTLWAALTLIVATMFRIASCCAFLRDPSRNAPLPEVPEPRRLPRISVLVPLFREAMIADVLIRRLSRLTYPKSLLDVVFILEENDHLTRKTLAAIHLPHWIRCVTVPEGVPKTKPRAMNYALDFCRGEIIGIWDAEDAPDPDQLAIVAQHFDQAPKDVVCLQGVLDYYNSRQNWFARCFTIEYAAWFRLMLPGMARLGFAVPLGGTTLFFRREVLEELGGWDAHNVTEDADLGFRLARHGYRTEVLSTTTGEEANCHPWPWIKQRSRWLKGYIMTYLVNMRSPVRLYRQMGACKFWGLQAHFITALSQFFLAPFLWSFWLIILGLPHPLNAYLPSTALTCFGLLFFSAEVINIMINALAVRHPAHRHLLKWVPTMHFYFLLGTFAAYKALYELIFCPFYWDKTLHGLSLSSATKAFRV